MSALARSTAGRSVYLKVQPRPRSITDTKRVLEVLRKYGEVEMFKHLKYEVTNPNPSGFLAIYKDARSASQTTFLDEIDFEYDGRIPAKMLVKEAQIDHEHYIARQPYTNAFPRTPSNALFHDMRNTMPPGLWAASHIDYNAQERPGQAISSGKEHQRREKVMGPSGYMGIWEKAQKSKKSQSHAGQSGDVRS